MTVWHKARAASWSTRAVVAAGVLAVLLVAAVPAAFVAGLILVLLGEMMAGVALFGACVLAALAAVVVAWVSGVHHLRRLLTRAGEQPDIDPDPRVVRLDKSEYDYR